MDEKRTKNFLKRSFVSLIVIFIVVFISLTVFMAKKTQESIIEVSEIYMSEMNVQIQQKFSSIISLRLVQVEGIIKRTPPTENAVSDEILEDLRKSGEVRNFSYLAFYTQEGEIEIIYGDPITLSDKKDITKFLSNNENIVTHGINEKGEKFLILGYPAEYLMQDGTKSTALIAGVSMDYLNDALYLDSEKTMVYSHIIDHDGTFIIRNGGIYNNSYFEQIKKEFDDLHRTVAEKYISELQKAMENGEDYSTFVSVNGEERHVYCSPISENSGWYLITVMPNGILDSSITKLDTLRIMIMMGSSFIILVAMSIVFYLYFKLSGRQMRRLDEAKQDAIQANKAKSEFLSSMSHDIRTPMNAIIGMTEIAMKNFDNPARVRDCLDKVKLSSKHLLGLINDVLDMSKIESGKMSMNMNPMSLKETMDDIVNIMQPQIKSRNQSFDIFIQNIISEDVYCDSIRLNQVLLNLLSNAVKFTPEQGRIDVRLYQEASPWGEEYVRTHLVVEDTGIGMSKEFQEKIFETFERENTEQVQNITGTGLGMSITKCIVDMMRGNIELQSEKGKGTKFHVTLDLKKAEANIQNMKLPAWNILVVDDNEQLCTSAAADLEELGAHADWTLDGRKAVEMIEERHKKQDDYHFVLIDWKMPNMDGLETIREIHRRIGKDIPMFLISAYDWSDIEDEVRESNIEGFISKPLFKSTLYFRLNQYAEESNHESRKKQTIDFTGKHILLAEDIDLNWEIANEILSSFGLEIERAVNGQDCVEKFQQSEVGFYDVILMDIRMPVMNGLDATKAIRQLDREDSKLPIIAMTADAFSDDAQNCFDCGMDAHLAKPLDIKECVRILNKYLGSDS